MFENLIDTITDVPERKRKTKAEIFNDYDGFVKKFELKKTTDDCYTPQAVYECVKNWVSRNIASKYNVLININN